MDPSTALVMAPCTTNLQGTFEYSVAGGHRHPGDVIEVDIQVHAIGHRDAPVSGAHPGSPVKPGTWYLISPVRGPASVQWNPRWIHGDDPRLVLR